MVDIIYTARGPKAGEVDGIKPGFIYRYIRHLGYSNDGLDSLWYLVDVSNKMYTMQALKTRGSYSSPRAFTEDQFFTHFTLR